MQNISIISKVFSCRSGSTAPSPIPPRTPVCFLSLILPVLEFHMKENTMLFYVSCFFHLENIFKIHPCGLCIGCVVLAIGDWYSIVWIYYFLKNSLIYWKTFILFAVLGDYEQRSVNPWVHIFSCMFSHFLGKCLE